MIRHPPSSPLFPSTPLSRPPRADSRSEVGPGCSRRHPLRRRPGRPRAGGDSGRAVGAIPPAFAASRSEEHTSELQSLAYLVCRLLLEKKKKKNEQLHVHKRG